jgi:penicillin amidase
VIIGFNDSLAWGVTNAGRDVLDYYELKFKDSTQNEYWYNGAWKATTKRTEIIKVKDSADVIEEIPMTHWGPAMYDAHYQNPQSNGRNRVGQQFVSLVRIAIVLILVGCFLVVGR